MTYTTNLRRQRIFEEQRVSNKHIARDSSHFYCKDLNPSSNAKVEDILFSSQEYINAILELKIFARRSNQRIKLL